MKEVWDVIGIVFTIIGWYLTGIISIGAFNALWEPSFDLRKLNKTAVKLLVLALLGPILLTPLVVYIFFMLAVSSFRREWDMVFFSVRHILLGFKDLAEVETETEISSLDFPTVSP